MSIFQLECFLAVAEHLSFAKAALQMNVSQPAITHQIQSLEQELHARLFTRTTRMVTLTVEGMVFLTDARTIVETARGAERRFASGDLKEITSLSIGCSSPSFMEYLCEPIREITKRHPSLHPTVTLVQGAQALERLETGSLDLIITAKIGSLKSKAVSYQEMGLAPMVCICPADHPLAAKQELTRAALSDSTLVLHRPGTAAPEILNLQHRLLESKHPSELYFCDTGEAAILLVRAGLGITMLPRIYIPQAKEIRVIPITDADPISYGSYYRTKSEEPLVREWIRIIASHVNN